MVELLLKHNANIQGQEGRAVMKAAADNIWPSRSKDSKPDNRDLVAIIKILERRGVGIDLPTAISIGSTDDVKALLQSKPDLEGAQSATLTLLTRAVQLNHIPIVRLLLDHGALVNGKTEDGYTPLHSAAFWGHDEITKLLIERKANVNAASTNGMTPLHESARLGTLSVAKLLIEAGANVNAKDKEGRTPLEWVSTRGDSGAMTKVLSDSSANNRKTKP